MSEQTPTEQNSGQQPPTGDQEPKTFDADYVDRLRKEAAKYRTEAKANAEAAKRLSALEESQKTETQKLLEERDALRVERDALRVERDSLHQQALRTRIALDKKVGTDLLPEFIGRLRGDTEDELSEDADRLLALLKPSGPHRFGDVDLGVRQTAPAPGSDEREVARSLFGQT